MILSLISAVAKNGVIGGGNTLLWSLPADMKHFRDTTSRHTVIMGRKTYESIGKPLPNRKNIVITRDANYMREGVDVVNSLDEAIRLVTLEHGKEFEENQDEVEAFVIGGGEIYKQAIDRAQKLYITEVHQDFDGDTRFPEIDNSIWREVHRADYEPDEKNSIPYSFVEYKKSA